MTFEVTIDLISVILVILIPTLIVFCCGIALAVTKRFETFFVGKYVQKVVKENNKLIQENRKLREDLEYKKL